MRSSRAAALCLSLLGSVVNFFVAAQLLSLWRSIKWESDSEWEGSVDTWRVDGIKIVWGLLSAYFATASVACVVGFIGVVKRVPSYVRLYRDYSVADLGFCAFSTILFALTSFRPAIRTTICEALSRQPELLRDLAEAGLNLENCEQWFEHAVVAVVGVSAVMLVVRLQFILTVSTYYKHLLRQHFYSPLELCQSPIDDTTHRRIYLLPSRSSISSPSQVNPSHHHNSTAPSHSRHSRTRAASSPNVLVYAPVPLNSLSEEEARQLDAAEAWVSHTDPCHVGPHSLSNSRHARSRSQSAVSHRHSSGRISLPIRVGEGLLPTYAEADTQSETRPKDKPKA